MQTYIYYSFINIPLIIAVDTNKERSLVTLGAIVAVR